MTPDVPLGDEAIPPAEKQAAGISKAERLRRAGTWGAIGARSAISLGSRAAKGLGGAIARADLPRRLYELTPRKEDPTPRGLFYFAHVGLELLHRIEARSIFVLPGGVSFFVLLGLLPATAAIASIYGLVAEPSELITLTERLNRILPESAMMLISGVFERVAAAPPSSLGISAAVALFMTLMSANWGTKAMSEALNVVFDRRETRSYFQYTGVTLLMTTTAAVITGAYAWIMYRLLDDPLNLGVAHYVVTGLEAASIWALLSFIIGVLYRYAPAPKLDGNLPPIMSGGSMTAALGVLISSWFLTSQFAGTETFVRNFGPLASVAAVGVWSWTTTVVILLGAEIVEIHEEEKRRRTRTRRWPNFANWS